MNNWKCIFIITFVSLVTFTSCRKNSDPIPGLGTMQSFSFPSDTDLKVDLSWTVNGQPNAYNAVDLDLVIHDDATSRYTPYYVSSTNTSYESVTIGTNDPNRSLKVGFIFFAYYSAVAPTPPSRIEYTIKVYPVGNTSAAKFYTGSFMYPTTMTTANNIIYNQLEFLKSTFTYQFTELGTKNPYVIY